MDWDSSLNVLALFYLCCHSHKPIISLLDNFNTLLSSLPGLTLFLMTSVLQLPPKWTFQKHVHGHVPLLSKNPLLSPQFLQFKQDILLSTLCVGFPSVTSACHSNVISHFIAYTLSSQTIVQLVTLTYASLSWNMLFLLPQNILSHSTDPFGFFKAQVNDNSSLKFTVDLKVERILYLFCLSD